MNDLDPFDGGCPADTISDRPVIIGKIEPPVPEDCAWAVLVCYAGIGPRLLGFETRADALTYISDNQDRHPMHLVRVPVPSK